MAFGYRSRVAHLPWYRLNSTWEPLPYLAITGWTFALLLLGRSWWWAMPIAGVPLWFALLMIGGYRLVIPVLVLGPLLLHLALA